MVIGIRHKNLLNLTNGRGTQVSMRASPVNEDALETSVHEIGHEGTVVSSDRFDTLAVHLVVLVRFCKIEACIPLFVYKQVGEVNLEANKSEKSPNAFCQGFINKKDKKGQAKPQPIRYKGLTHS